MEAHAERARESLLLKGDLEPKPDARFGKFFDFLEKDRGLRHASRVDGPGMLIGGDRAISQRLKTVVWRAALRFRFR